ncbi:MAG TPA: pyrroline-5-carboxylate reductase, partial [Clostridiales bacterium]|nr:pyrroline-5-carboxylate reductase [Clostridiales bacterium]
MSMNMNTRIGFIGAGKMGSAIAKGISGSGKVFPGNIHIYDIDSDKTALLHNETGVSIEKSSIEVIEKCDIIVLAVVPGIIKSVLEPCSHLFDNSKIFVSIAAGVPIKVYKEILGDNAKIVRTMPNRPALIGRGMTLISFEKNSLSEIELYTIKDLFECVGKVEVLDESLMDEVIALTSSSPAYVFMLIEAMANAAVLMGIPAKSAYTMAAQAVSGSAEMVLETGRHPAELKDEICTPAGTTIEAVKALEKNGFRYAIIEAMEECTKKARKIGEKYNK